MLMSSYTWSRMRENVTPLNPWEEPEERVAAVDRPHRITFASRGRAARRPRPPLGRRTGIPSSTRFSADGSSARSSSGRVGQPLVFNNNTYFDPACGDPKDLKANWGKDGSGAFRRRRRAGHRHHAASTRFRTSRSATPRDSRSPSRPPKSSSASRTSARSRRRCPNVRFMKHHLLDFGADEELLGRRSRAGAVAHRGAERDQLHAFGSGNVMLTPANNATFMRLNNIDSSTVMKPRDIQIGARVTF